MARQPKQQNPNDVPEEMSEEPSGPNIRYFGEGAKDVKFNVDENAKNIHVYSHGRVTVDY